MKELSIWEKAMGWRKRQMVQAQIDQKFEVDYKFELYVSPSQRNVVLEEVAKEIEKFTAFGPDTTGSFAVYIRSMKT